MKPAPDRRLSSLKLKHGLWVKILSSLPTRGSSRLPAFFLLRHRAARASAACAQILPPQGRRSIWREHGVVRVLCAVHKNARCRAKLCCCCTKCPAARCAVTVGTLGDQGLHTQLTTEINVLRVAHCRALPHCASRCSGKFVMKSFYIDLLLSQPAQPII